MVRLHGPESKSRTLQTCRLENSEIVYVARSDPAAPQERLILYGCGDFLNDYEGIGGYEDFRSGLAIMYFAELDPATDKLLALRMILTQARRLRVKLACKADSQWLEAMLNRKGKGFRTRVTLSAENALTLCWD